MITGCNNSGDKLNSGIMSSGAYSSYDELSYFDNLLDSLIFCELQFPVLIYDSEIFQEDLLSVSFSELYNNCLCNSKSSSDFNLLEWLNDSDITDIDFELEAIVHFDKFPVDSDTGLVDMYTSEGVHVTGSKEVFGEDI